MKNLFLLLFVFTSYQTSAQLKLTKIWETKDLATPESVLPLGKLLYVSLIDGDGSKTDGLGGVALLKADGSVVNKNWVSGLNAPKGMGMFKGKLYVADINEVVVIDVKTAKVESKVKIEEAVFLNDVAINSKGAVFVSDTRLGKIYKIVDNKFELFLDNMKNANGLKFVEDELYVLSGPTLVKVGSDKVQKVIASGLAAGGDGLEPYKKGEFIATCWIGLVYHIKADGTSDLLMDSRAEKINTADIGYDAKKKIMYVPTFLKNSVVAYRLD